MSDLVDKKLSEIDESTIKLGELVVRVQLARRTGEVNVDETVELITRAKGTRSIRKFAEDLGVNASSLSRILNGNVTELRAAMLAKIAFYADKQSGVTIENLMKAQGLSDPQDLMITAAKYESECRRIFMDELIQRGFTVTGYKAENRDTGFDFEVTTDALKNGSGKWALEVKFLNRHNPVLPSGIGRSRISIEHAMANFYLGKNDYQRISLVVDHPMAFKQIKAYLSTLNIPNEISVILVNIDKRTIEDEYVAPLTGGGDPNAVFNPNGKGDM